MTSRRYTLTDPIRRPFVGFGGTTFSLSLRVRVADAAGCVYIVETWRAEKPKTVEWNTAVLDDSGRHPLYNGWVWDTWQEARESHHLIARRLAAGLSVEDFA